jgi:hypothetical protein
MKHRSAWVVLLGILGGTIATRAAAQEDPACVPVDTCVDAGTGSLLTGCLAPAPSCDATNPDRFGLSSGTLATRAVGRLGCDTTSTKKSCTQCYRRAARPLKLRLDGELFHGMLAHAARIIATQAAARCPTLP